MIYTRDDWPMCLSLIWSRKLFHIFLFHRSIDLVSTVIVISLFQPISFIPKAKLEQRNKNRLLYINFTISYFKPINLSLTGELSTV